MSRLSPEIQRNFTGGEQSPELDARADIARWRTGLRTLENMVALIRGVVTRRSGFLDVAAALADSVLREFAFSDSDAYAIEFGNLKARFYRDYGFLETSPGSGTPYELTTPFATAELADIHTAQSADTLYITSGARKVQKMKRLASTSWTIADAAFRNGPFLDANTDETLTITTTKTGELVPGTTGMAMVASAALFQAGHVGALFRLEIKDQAEFGKWAAGDTGFISGSKVYWGDNCYAWAAQHGNTGVQPPVHLRGSAWDGSIGGVGDNAIKWTYLHSGYGIIRITAVTDSTHATAEAVTYIPSEIRTVGTWRWSEGAFSDYRGWPKFCAISDNRLHLMSTTSDPTGGWASVTDDFESFDADHPDEDTAAFKYRLGANRGKVNLPRFLCAADRLVIGTAGDEHVLISADGNPPAPDSFRIATPTTEGAADAEGVRVEDVVFISADGERLLELAGDQNSVRQDAYVANDLTLYADHISGGGFSKIVWQREPYRLLWALRTDGVLASCSYRRDQNVLAWSRHPMTKGEVQDICAVPSPAKKRQDLWAIVSRPLLAGTVRRIECLSPFFQKGDKDVTEGVFVDSAVTYDNVSPSASCTGLARFNGEAVSVLADGKVVRGLTVASDAITLPKAASKVVVGLPIPWKLRTLRCDKDVAGGALSVKVVRNTGPLIVDVMDSAGISAHVGELGDKAPQLLKPTGGAVSDAAAVLHTGPLAIDVLESDWKDGDVTLLGDAPLPATIRAIAPPYQVAR